MKPHYFKPMQVHDARGKVVDADWCVYIDKPVTIATQDDFCQQQASHPYHVQTQPEGRRDA